MLQFEPNSKKTKLLLTAVLALMLFPAGNAQAQNTNEAFALDAQTQRKFDYYFYEALNAKVQEKYDKALDLLLYCYAMDSTNASVLNELGSFYNVLDEHSKALRFFRKAVKYDPSNYYYNVALAEQSKEMGLKTEVIDVYRYLLKLYPEKVELNFDLANAYTDNGEFQKAIDALNVLEKSIGISESTALNKFRLYSMLNEKDRAFEEVQSIIGKNPGDVRYVILKGDLYLQDNQPDKALECYDAAKDIDPDFPALVLSMAGYYEKTNNKTAAEEELKKAILSPKFEVDNKIQLLTRYIGILQESKQDIKSVNPLFDTLFDQHPHNTQLNFIYGNVLMLEDNKTEAEKHFERYNEENPQDPAGYEQLLRIALPDSLDKVIAITEKGIANIPSAPQFYFYHGGALYQQKHYKEALKSFEDGLENATIENPLVESDFYGQIGDLNYFLNNKSLAFENYEKALKLNPQNVGVLNNYSYYLSLEKKDLDKAEQMSGITVKAEPTNPTYLDTYGWILFEQGDYTTARIYLEKAVRYSETGEEEEASATIYEHYGDLLIKTGETEKAVEQWMKAKKLGSDSKTIDKKIKKKKYIEEK
ncbi:MAG: tetratricopeptide repeat protein [Dysgonamonadaceae bacterium]|jgi:tetratricopeptide (TPR) repeat protein|nr:tetratricopeptide repeat protein [Dysgonamonadaceae bacterium]